MIILIAGTTHTGKTKLSQTLLERFRYPTLSLDHLKMGLIRSGVCDLTPEDDELLVPYLWSITAEIIKTAIENNQNLIVEGCYIPFDWRNSFEPHYLSSIEYCCLIMTPNYITTHKHDIIRHADDIEQRLNDCLDDLFFEEIIQDNADNLAKCNHYQLPYCLIEETYSTDNLVIKKFDDENTKPLFAHDTLKAAQLFYETIHAVNRFDYSSEQLEAWAPTVEPFHSESKQRIINKLSNQYSVAAKECGLLIGFGSLDENHDVDMLYVHKDRQQQRIASCILSNLEQEARNHGKTAIATFASITARTFFTKQGYRVIRENIVIRNGVELKNYLMEKQL